MMILIINVFVAIVLVLSCETVTGQNDAGRWIQFGNTITAPAGNQFFGSEVTMSVQGTTIATSCSSPSPTSVAKILKFNNASRTWEQLGSDISGDLYVSMSADGTMIVVTDIIYRFTEKFALVDYTLISVYKLGTTTNEWEMVGTSFRYGGRARGYISSDGTTVAINHYEVSVYKLYTTPSLRWVQVGKDILSEGINSYPGSIALSANGTILAIGSPFHRGINGTYSGHVRVFKLYSTPTSRWVKIGFNIDGEAKDDFSGEALAMSADGTILAIGAKYNDGKFGVDLGHVRIFKLDASRWSQLGSDIDGESLREYSGSSIDLSSDGTTIAIGATGKNVNKPGLGRVLVYKFYPSPSRWIPHGSDIVSPLNARRFGSSVAISADGRSIAVLAWGTGYDSNPGQVRVYKFTPNEEASGGNVRWNLYNSRTNTLVGTLRNGTIVTRPPPCNYTNIEAVISSCVVTNNTVLMKLYSHDMKRLIRQRVETGPKFYLYGNDEKNNDVYDGRIYPGTYNLQLRVNGVQSEPTKFTIQNNGSCS